MMDIHWVDPIHEEIHDRLLNWSRHVRFGGGYRAATTPMFRHYRSYRGWHPVTPTIPVNSIDGHTLEKAVSFLPEQHRDAIRWFYVYSELGMGFFKACRAMHVYPDLMCKLVHDGRSMLKNRLDSKVELTIIPAKPNPASAVSLSQREAEPSGFGELV